VDSDDDEALPFVYSNMYNYCMYYTIFLKFRIILIASENNNDSQVACKTIPCKITLLSILL
jgi:hypothetical protein